MTKENEESVRACYTEMMKPWKEYEKQQEIIKDLQEKKKNLEQNNQKIQAYLNLVEKTEELVRDGSLKNQSELHEHVRKIEACIMDRRALETNSESVQGYLHLIKDIEELTRRTIQPQVGSYESLVIAANTVKDEESTNNIWVYMGTYENYDYGDMLPGQGVRKLEDECPNFGWKTYKNIELKSDEAETQITKRELSIFEKENTILYAPEGVSPYSFYYQVRRLFFETLIASGQEEAVRTIKSTYGQSANKDVTQKTKA